MSSSLRSDASGLLGALQVNGVDTVTFDSAGVNLGVEHPIKSIVASVAANALTVGLATTTLEFRGTTLSNGATTRLISPSQTMTIPSGATLGTVNGVPSRVHLLAINNAGTVELAVTSLASGLSLDESTLINTTALSGSSNTTGVIYSTVARTGVPFRIVGTIDSTQATAGTWATPPSLVQGAGGTPSYQMEPEILYNGSIGGAGSVTLTRNLRVGDILYIQHNDGSQLVSQTTPVHSIAPGRTTIWLTASSVATQANIGATPNILSFTGFTNGYGVAQIVALRVVKK